MKKWIFGLAIVVNISGYSDVVCFTMGWGYSSLADETVAPHVRAMQAEAIYWVRPEGTLDIPLEMREWIGVEAINKLYYPALNEGMKRVILSAVAKGEDFGFNKEDLLKGAVRPSEDDQKLYEYCSRGHPGLVRIERIGDKLFGYPDAFLLKCVLAWSDCFTPVYSVGSGRDGVYLKYYPGRPDVAFFDTPASSCLYLYDKFADAGALAAADAVRRRAPKEVKENLCVKKRDITFCREAADLYGNLDAKKILAEYDCKLTGNQASCGLAIRYGDEARRRDRAEDAKTEMMMRQLENQIDRGLQQQRRDSQMQQQNLNSYREQMQRWQGTWQGNPYHQ